MCNIILCFLLHFLLLRLKFIMPFYIYNSNASNSVQYRFSTLKLGFKLHEILANSKRCFFCDLSFMLDDVKFWLFNVGMQPWGMIAASESILNVKRHFSRAHFLDLKKTHRHHGATRATVQYIMAHLHNIIKNMRQNLYLHKLDATSRKIWQKKRKTFPECPDFLEGSFHFLSSDPVVLRNFIFPDLFSTDHGWHQQELGIVWQTASSERMLYHTPLLTSQLAVKTRKGNSKGL